jgi:hypothetical protein
MPTPEQYATFALPSPSVNPTSALLYYKRLTQKMMCIEQRGRRIISDNSIENSTDNSEIEEEIRGWL